ncbi:hypothetical protein TNCV_1196611 [Trichonephila clavipes]|uniref:Uncharacterized protein n=1 Tax=Trichonephila clavipes TaxID=2585209 RepID=A0A8X6S009_TRICX|nr:hypothetical protein TNCV_1196611 [Trichonephila clavipes]
MKAKDVKSQIYDRITLKCRKIEDLLAFPSSSRQEAVPTPDCWQSISIRYLNKISTLTSGEDDRFGVIDKVLVFGTEGAWFKSSYISDQAPSVPNTSTLSITPKRSSSLDVKVLILFRYRYTTLPLDLSTHSATSVYEAPLIFPPIVQVCKPSDIQFSQQTRNVGLETSVHANIQRLQGFC